MLASAPPGQVEDTSEAMFSHNLHNTSSSSGFRHTERHLNGATLRVNETNGMSGIACLGVDQTQVSKRWGSTRPNLSESGAISVLGLRLV